ncbi:hypothetical protein L9W84_18280 [Vibrio aestuarianus]|nr:hypothetical protein [Vibrio cholerae]MBZ6074665.1 hypothetical protein [Aeromonas schubertii]MCA2416461.1 hypothetical protein [Vibrio chemaguriensis]MCA2455844.1 hypothetical protein [Vibrio alginolyticus]MCC4225866.1 hypothetical protein [Vibrio campbellii]MCF6455093.1 hypothetical protein [Vibrio sp. MMG023]MCF7370883.1 hypothetical protein [Vibrio sp. J2-3(2022)]MCF7479784.1 hypothetical protein [Vibrio sp. J2-4]MCG6242041.1 hypothetical protein [Vibrio diabolicus]MCG6298285.1 hypo
MVCGGIGIALLTP